MFRATHWGMTPHWAIHECRILIVPHTPSSIVELNIDSWWIAIPGDIVSSRRAIKTQCLGRVESHDIEPCIDRDIWLTLLWWWRDLLFIFLLVLIINFIFFLLFCFLFCSQLLFLLVYSSLILFFIVHRIEFVFFRLILWKIFGLRCLLLFLCLGLVKLVFRYLSRCIIVKFLRINEFILFRKDLIRM